MKKHSTTKALEQSALIEQVRRPLVEPLFCELL